MEYIKKVVTMAIMITVIIISGIGVSAESNADIIISENETEVGKNIDVELEFNEDKDIGWVDTNLLYDKNILKFESSDNASGGNGILSVHGLPEADSGQIVIKLKFSTIGEGTCNLSLSNCMVHSQSGAVISTPSEIMSEEIKVRSSENNISSQNKSDGYKKAMLKSLTVSEGKLEPDFSPYIYNYTVKVDSSVEIVEVEGETANETDYIWYEGTKWIADGDNRRLITVTDNEGNKNVYIITIQRASSQKSQKNENQEFLQSSENNFEKPIKQEKAVSSASEQNKNNKKDVLTQVLFIVLFVLIIMFVVIVVWIKNKTMKKKKKIKKRKK